MTGYKFFSRLFVVIWELVNKRVAQFNHPLEKRECGIRPCPELQTMNLLHITLGGNPNNPLSP
jgi:hypothetical protein